MIRHARPPAELRGRLLVEHAARADRGVGHADVQPPPALHRRRDDPLAAGRVGRVGVLGHRLAARRNDFRGHVVGRPAPVRVRDPVAVVDHDLRALPGQRPAERAAEPPAAAGHHRHPPGQRRVTHDPALILYTSGTTGVPKGVELTGRNIGCALHELHASIELDEGSVCAAPVPFFHVAGLGMLLAANLNGGNLLLEQQADIAGVLRLVDRKVTHAVLVPTVLQRLLALPECRTADWCALSYVV